MSKVERVFEQIEMLSPQERQQVKERLDRLTPSAQTEQEKIAELNRRLREIGLLRERRQPTPEELAAAANWRPIPVRGKPISEAIIEERR